MSTAGGAMAATADLEAALLLHPPPFRPSSSSRRRAAALILAMVAALTLVVVVDLGARDSIVEKAVKSGLRSSRGPDVVESEVGVVAADDGRCSEIGASVLQAGGHAVDAAVATALCLGVVNPMSSGVGGGAFIVIRSSETGDAVAIDARETAPAAASKDMYQNKPEAKSMGPLSMGIPGEIAGLQAAWLKYGRLPWKSLFQPSIKLAREGFEVAAYLADHIEDSKDSVMADAGLREIFAPDGKLLQTGEICYNPQLAKTLEQVSIFGPEVFYNGTAGEEFIADVRRLGGIATMEDLRNYKTEVMEAISADVMGYTILGMPPPSSGTLGMSLILNVLGSYESNDGAEGLLGLHRFIEALKHMFAIRMNLGDPDFVNVTKYEDAMLSLSFAEKIRERINDNTTFDPDYYRPRWSQLRDHGTSHISIVDGDRNAVSLTSTVNYYFGARVLSPSTGIVLNNEMDDFSVPAEITPDKLPPAPANFIEPNKRPLSSMTPIIVLKDNQLAGVLGGSGGLYIIPAVTQVFINHFVLGMEPLAAVQRPRVYHKLIPNVVLYENWTAIDGEQFDLTGDTELFLEQRGHQLSSISGGAVCQFVVQNLKESLPLPKGKSKGVFHGMLTAVSDPRKDGAPAGL